MIDEQWPVGAAGAKLPSVASDCLLTSSNFAGWPKTPGARFLRGPRLPVGSSKGFDCAIILNGWPSFEAPFPGLMVPCNDLNTVAVPCGG